MNPNNSNLHDHGFELQPCPECPYPMNILVNSLPAKNTQECFAVTCRECGDSWTEVLEMDNDNEKN